MLFNAVAYQESLNAMQGSGMIGLAPKKLDDDETDTELFVDALDISTKMFSVNVPENRVTFGAKDSNTAYHTFRPPHKIKDTSNYWEVPLKAAKYGSSQIFNSTTKKIFFDTGTSFNMLP